MSELPTATQVREALAELANPEDARNLQRFFKTAPGEYGEGDVFLGVRVPASRHVAKRFATLPLEQIDELLDSPVHEERLTALFVLNLRFAAASKPRTRDDSARAEMVALYLAAVRRGRVNNWDLVDASAEHIIGPWLLDKDRALLFQLAQRDSLWERRVALLSTFAFIKAGEASTTLELAEILLADRRDLIQKALGWMLREVGKRVDRAVLTGFLDIHAPEMGRTALSYATEHLAPEQRAAYRALR
ncbi:DNA alkylation repair protein [Nocardia mangyaensis]|uniref:DNA alkylation repair protein n=1 Tax=Nocardia mangyaensis TaxID=2213200 RepID=UPI002674CADF|nr:DNA alkylation repair protein [Nocardia mangyaensis]MDO3649811.1 DNA alkylation repair protein [Nocardia mangyaensis]